MSFNLWNRKHPVGMGRVLSFLFDLGAFCLMAAAITGCSRYVRTARLNFVELGPEGILRHASDQAGNVNGLLSTGTLQLRMERGGLSARCAILYARPDSIRLDISAALGTTILQAVMAGPRIQVYVPLEKTVVEGSVDRGEILEFGGIPLELSSLRELVLGPAVAMNWVELAADVDRLDIRPDEIMMSVPLPGGFRLQLELGTDLYYRRTALSDPEGRIVLESHFEDYRRIGGASLPGLVRIVYPQRFLEVTYEVARQKVDPDRSPGDFVLELPEGIRRLPLVPPSIDIPCP